MDLTIISQNEYDYIANTCMTADEAITHLNEDMVPRSFGETLTSFAKGADIKKTLTDALCSYSPNVSRDGIQKKIRGWLGGKYEPADRETYMQICFAFSMNDETAQDFLCHCSDCGFHYRNPRELTYAFALRTGMSYNEAVELYNSLPPLPEESGGETVYTESLYNEFYYIRTEEEFRSFYENNLEKFGTLHNTAYNYFINFINVLRDPDMDRQDLLGIDAEKSDKFSIEKITEDYLRMNVPAGTSKSKYTYIQRVIKKYWPSATSIKNMLSRSEDVTRKTLMLLYIITEGIAPDVNYDFVIDDELTPQERFGEHYDRICIMMTDCGMALPDPRNVFDWVALYAVKMNNSEEISREMQSLLERIFAQAERELTDGEFDVLQ